ncbi:HET domain-containing protein [Fusarium keratoplasticum]|uniref:HET domain-containing protein n=1 Tax=Fusarium keratoplasticum TaxID=1328300 RepID=A0ACC0QM75_9HYPO|nr:HET domain-containing protein [Fusarium keratoplasticum]KAI8660254.1 HET domain-containing protein [Fusarium keratoplasticum]KAI8661276.1 HET domain-containing protein [Fusarium keratoplasticum]
MLRGRVEGYDEVLTVYPFAKRGDPLAALIPRRPVHRDVQSNTVFAAARRLIHECLRPDNPSEGHTLCRYSRDTVLPTRVLDVGDPSDPDSSTRLKINEVETHGSYLALSYCWGKRDPTASFQPLLLRRNSLHDLTSQIRPENLQRSIQDAICVTRKLGFRYIWVDALCIIQDDDDDKDNEISQMATIYKNAVITLAAGTAEKASEGFLGNPESRPTVYLPENKFAIPMDTEGEIGTVYLSADPYEPDHPLDKRGWTLQEFMLSSRMLIFSDYQLLWQCKEVELRSVTGDSRGMEYQQPLESLPWTVFDEEAEPRFGTSASEKLYIWKTIILQYTERELSDPNDRLRAVSGITTELEKLWRDSNIWGLWRKWFISLLAWYKVEIDRVDKRNLGRAPSWSWASLDGRINYKDPVEVADAKISALTVASVVLSCRILNADNANESVVEWPDLADEACKEHGLTRLCPPGSRGQCRLNLMCPSRKEVGENDLLYLLLGTAKPDSRGGKGLGLGLLVMQVADGRYRRIGLAVFPDMSIWKGVKRQTVEFEPKH